MPDKLDIAAYIEAAGHASNRSRWTTLVVVVASMLVFAALWNSRGGSWFAQRLRFTHCAYAAKTMDPGTRQSLPSEERERLAGCEQLMAQRGVATKEELKSVVDTLERARVEYITLVRVPLVGLAFDVNDLGMLGGFSFCVILSMLRYSLARELDNLRYVFARAREDGCVRECYELLAMKQVMTIPPSRMPPTVGWLAKRSVYVVFFLPVALQLSVLAHDWATRGAGRPVSDFNTSVTMGAGVFFLLLVAWLTWRSVSLALQANAEWRAQARVLGIVEP